MNRIVWIFILVIGTCAVAQARPICPGVGRLDGLRDGETRVQQLDVARMWIERDNRKQPASNGMPLCEKDLIVTTANVSAIVQLGQSGESSHDITLYPDSSIRLKKPNSVELVVGRLFASLHGAFDIWTTFGVLGARGTQFEVTMTSEGLDVTQLEGETAFPASPQLSKRIGVPSGFEWIPASYSFQDDPPPTVSRVPKGSQFTFRSKDPTALRIQKLDPKQCKRVSDDNSTVVSTTRARMPSRNLSLGFAVDERAKFFQEARAMALCADGDAARAQLVRVYADWAQPVDALAVLKNAQGEQDFTSPEVAASIAQSYRLAGDWGRANDYYGLALRSNPRYAVAYNGLGDVYRDRGLVAYGHKQTPQALDAFSQAQANYERSLRPDVGATDRGWGQAVPLANLGELCLIRAVMQPDQATAQLEMAEGYFNQALSVSGGDAPFATAGLARADIIRAELIPDVTVSGGNFLEILAKQLEENRKVKERRRPFLESAQRRLRPLIDAHPEFSVASEAYGTTYLLLDQTQEAARRFVTAIQLDPHNAAAYIGFAATANAKTRELYRNTADAIDYPAFREVTQARERIHRGGDIPAVPANEIAPSASRLSFSSANYEQTVTLTVNGTATLPIDQVTIGGEDAGAFRVRQDTCSGQSFAPSQSCTVTVVFGGGGDGVAIYQATPTKTSFSATLSIRSSASNIATNVEMRGKVP